MSITYVKGPTLTIPGVDPIAIRCAVDLLAHPPVVNFLYYNSIMDVYLGYRQCYSRDLEENTIAKNLAMTEEDIELYTERAVSYYKWLGYDVDQKLAEVVANSNPKWATYLKMCWFIYKHMNHQSPLEHCVFHFQFRHMSRACQQQLTRHRIGTFSIASQRYIPFLEKDKETFIYMPESIAEQPTLKALYADHIEQLVKTISEMRELAPDGLKIPDEDLRYLYPNAMTSDGIWSINLRALMHFLEERCCTKAQEEIRYFADQILEHLQLQLPFIGTQLGPKCHALKYCPETKPCGEQIAFKKKRMELVDLKLK